MVGKRCPPRPQTKSTHVWDMVAEEYNKNVPTDRQRDKGQLENKYNNLKKAFRAYCRDLHSKAKSGAGRDELLLVAKPQSHDMFMRYNQHAKPLSTTPAVSMQQLADSLDSQATDAPEEDHKLWYDILYPDGWRADAAQEAHPEGHGSGGGDEAADDEDPVLPRLPLDADAPVVGGPLGGARSASKNKTNAPRGRPSTSGVEKRDNAAAAVLSQATMDGATALAEAMASVAKMQSEDAAKLLKLEAEKSEREFAFYDRCAGIAEKAIEANACCVM